MHVNAFNACLFIGWLLVLAGGVWLNRGAGLAVAGVLLILLALLSARVAGGIYIPSEHQEGSR